MKTKSVLIIAVLCTAILASCKKDKDNSAAVTRNKIEGRWQVDSIVTNQHFNGSSSKTNYPGHSGDYIDFSTDGIMSTYFDGNTDKASYSVRNDTTIVIGGDSGKINELTDNKLVIYTNAQAGVIGYVETTYYLKK